MRSDNVVPWRQAWMEANANLRSFFLRDCFGRVIVGIQIGSTMEALFGAGGTDELKDCLVAGQWFSCPVAGNQTEHPMVDGVPLRRARRVVRDDDFEIELIGHCLECRLPFPLAIIVCAAGVCLDQQSARSWITFPTDFQPPATDRRLCERRS